MDRVQIDYLQDKQPDKTGKGKTLRKKTCWNRRKLGNHKRSGNCVGQAMEERQYFCGLVSKKSTTIPSPLPVSNCIEEPPPPKKSKPAICFTTMQFPLCSLNPSPSNNFASL